MYYAYPNTPTIPTMVTFIIDKTYNIPVTNTFQYPYQTHILFPSPIPILLQHIRQLILLLPKLCKILNVTNNSLSNSNHYNIPVTNLKTNTTATRTTITLIVSKNMLNTPYI